MMIIIICTVSYTMKLGIFGTMSYMYVIVL
jgi:hypothetical protein